MKTTLPLVLFLAFLAGGCATDPPTTVDGNGTLLIVARWDATPADSLPGTDPLAGAKVIISSEYGTMVRETGADGVLRMDHLPAATYGVSIRGQHPLDRNIQLVGTVIGLKTGPGIVVVDTILAKPVSAAGIVINEIYASGPVNAIFFFFDQFIELYNASDSVHYLDGMIVMRVSGNNDGMGPGADEGGDGDMDGVTYAFKFPGKPGEHKCPITPGQFVVLASDAVDHRTVAATAVDLSHADYEFYNQYSPEDIDNRGVPNLSNMISDKTSDFLINLVSDVIVISSGEDSVWVDGIDIKTVVDGVEYQSNPEPVTKKTLDSRIDRGYTLSPPRYGGRSMQRIQPGFDTNDSRVDFEMTSAPSPGRQ
jgi:hypothetical protein